MRSQYSVLFISAFAAIFMAPPSAGQDRGLTPSQSAEGGNPIESLFKGFGRVLSSIVSPKGAELASLVEKNDLDAADAYLKSEQVYFSENEKANGDLIKALAEKLNARFEPQFDSSIRELESMYAQNDPARWPTMSGAISTAKNRIESYDRYYILGLARYRSAKYRDLSVAIGELTAKLTSGAIEAFRKFDHINRLSFFVAYPVSINERAVLSANSAWILETLDTVPASSIPKLAAKYPQIDALLRDAISAKYVSRILAEKTGAGKDFVSLYNTFREILNSSLGRNAKLDSIRVADVTREGPGKPFSIVVTNDTGLPLVKIASDSASQNPELQSADFVVAFSARANEPVRKVTSKSDITSKFESGQRTLPNPAYQQAQANYVNAEQELNRINIQNRTTSATGWGAILRGAAQGLQAGVKQKYFNELQATPVTLTEPTYSDYSFKVTTVESMKSGEILVSVWDRKNQAVTKYKTPFEEKRSFDIAFGINDKDPSKYTLGSKYVEEKTIDSFEQDRIAFQLSSALEKLVQSNPQFVPLSANERLFEDAAPAGVEEARTVAATGSSFTTTLESRLGSVVIVRNPSGALGSGFFVAPDLVLTNQHVVEGSKFAEIKLHNGTETVGRIVKVDIGLDLALIKVADKGVPIAFQTAPISAGATVEAVGHPKGLMFSVTRGIISAVRKMKNALVPGSREMVVIQTDAAINPGNSGGPLFLGDKVVGVNSQKFSAKGIEGIGFAVHFTEVARFLQDQ